MFQKLPGKRPRTVYLRSRGGDDGDGDGEEIRVHILGLSDVRRSPVPRANRLNMTVLLPV